MLRGAFSLLAVCLFSGPAFGQASLAQPYARPPQLVVAAPPHAQERLDLGGGFIEYLFGEQRRAGPIVSMPPPNDRDQRPVYANIDAGIGARAEAATPPFDIDPRYMRHEVAYTGPEAAGTIVIDTPNKFLYLVE